MKKIFLVLAALLFYISAYSAETVITTFQTGHGFTTGSHGTLSADTTDKIYGTQSLKLKTWNDGVESHAINSSLGPFDATGKQIVVYYKCSEVGTNLAYFILHVSSDAFATSDRQYNLKPLGVGTSMQPLQHNTWTSVSFGWSDTSSTSGYVTRTAINAINLQLRDNMGNSITAWFNKITLTDTGSSAVTFRFDDGFSETVWNAEPILTAAGFKASLMGIPDTFGHGGYMNLTSAAMLQNTHGWDICSHYQTDLTTMAVESLSATLSGVATYMKNNNFSGYHHFAYPNGMFDEKNILPLVKQNYSSASMVTSYSECMIPPDAFKTHTYSLLSYTAAASVNAAILNAYTEGRWIILIFHKILASPSALTDYSTADFQTIVNYVVSLGMPVKNITELEPTPTPTATPVVIIKKQWGY